MGPTVHIRYDDGKTGPGETGPAEMPGRLLGVCGESILSLNKSRTNMTTNNGPLCYDCGAAPGQLHELGCDVECCPYCGRQLLTCDHSFFLEEAPPDKDRIPWTGEWPGVAECRELGLYAKLTPEGWKPCRPDEPGAREDLNRLGEGRETRWDRKQKRWVLKKGFHCGAAAHANGASGGPAILRE
jgi:hypothetical protein